MDRNLVETDRHHEESSLMNLSDLSIRRPVFITCVVTLMLFAGLFYARNMAVDLMPNVSFPYAAVSIVYPGTSPEEIEQLITKPIEEEVGTISGVKVVNSSSLEGFSLVWVEFTLETDVKWAEQQVRDKVSATKPRLPKDIKEPSIARFDPSETPIMMFSLSGNLSESKLFEVADEFIRPKLEQVNQVSSVRVFGGQKREIHVDLDQNKLRQYDISATQVVSQIGASGQNIPLGSTRSGDIDLLHRSLSQFTSVDKIKTGIIRFLGDDVPVTVGDLGTVADSLTEEKSRAFINGKKSIFFYVQRQSGANTVQVVDRIHKQVEKIQKELSNFDGKPQITLVRDGSIQIRDNIADVKESIILGSLLAVIVVLLFLANVRSTIITGLALPNSLIGAFILMYFSNFSINMMSLLGLSLAVGLLVDDAIVVRENIFRHIEAGESPEVAARKGTDQVRLAVIATTLAVLAVFGSIAFIQGLVGQFLKEFGLTICYAMMISLFDALAVAPMLSAYFGGVSQAREHSRSWIQRFEEKLKIFDTFQDWLIVQYEKILLKVLANPLRTLASIAVIFIICMASLRWVTLTFVPQPDLGEYSVQIELPPGTHLEKTTEVSRQIDALIRQNPSVTRSALTVGTWSGESHKANIYFQLKPWGERKIRGSVIKDELRDQLKPFALARPQITDFDPMNGGLRPFAIHLVGLDFEKLEQYGDKLLAFLKTYPRLKEVDTTNRKGKPEFQVRLKERESQQLGVAGNIVGMELRTLIEGALAAKYREGGHEYDIRVRLKEDQRKLDEQFHNLFVPNVNFKLIRLPLVAEGHKTTGPAQINRANRMRVYEIQADYAPGAGLGDILQDLRKEFAEGPLKLPEGIGYKLLGEAELFDEMLENMILAALLGTLFIYLVLSSLYESFVTPFTIMLALPLAVCGAFVALAITRESLNIYSMISCIMLLGVAAKNSILLVDFANQLIRQGKNQTEALLEAGKERLRPILMTTMALIAGTIPIALGLNESSRQRASMGVAIVGGLISSTLLTLLVVPAAYSYIERFRNWAINIGNKYFKIKH